jgi:phosphate uptake regulator
MWINLQVKMRRKIIKQGNNSYTLTLPIKWVKEYNLDGADEVEIIEEEGSLKIVSEQKKIKKEISITINNKFEKNIRFILKQACFN